MRDELPRKGAQGLAAEALIAWVMRLYGEDGETEPLMALDMMPPDARAIQRRSNRNGNEPDLEPEPLSSRDTDSQLAVSAPHMPHMGALGPASASQPRQERPIWISLATRNGTFGHPLSIRAIALVNEQRLGTSKVHTLRHTFARGLEDAGAKVSEIQARLGHADLGTTGRYLAQLHAGENPHLARLSHLYGLEDRLKRQPPPSSDEK